MIFNHKMNSDGIGSKRKALELITNIFCKKPKENETSSANHENNDTNAVNSDHYSNRVLCQNSLSVPDSDTRSCFSDNLPKSPISPRVKNIQEDMEALMISRQDNPYIVQQLERLSTKESELFAELSVSAYSSPARTTHKLSVSNLEPIPITDSNFIIDSDIYDIDDNLHDKLIRSPPPQFPKHLSMFVYPGCSATSIHSLRNSDNNDLLSSRLFLSPNLSHNSHSDGKSKSSDISNEMGYNVYKPNDLRHQKMNQTLEPNSQKYLRCERRGSDSSIMSNNWKTSFYNQSMTASSSSLLSFVPRYQQTVNSCNSVSIDSHMSCNENQQMDSQLIDSNKKSSTDLIQVYSNSDDNSNQMSFMSPSNSREALLKDVSDVS